MSPCLLADRPEFAPQLAQWYQAEWPHLFPPGATALDEALCCAQSKSLPDCTIMLLENDEPAAAASLLVDDVLPMPECSPWLGTVIVRPGRRGAGLGTTVVREAMKHAARHGIDILHLWTPAHRKFYERLGWSHVRNFSLHEKDVAILRISLRENPANPAGLENPV